MSELLSKEAVLAKHIDFDRYDVPKKVNFWVGLALDEYAKQEAIEFRIWMDNQGYFAQMNDGKVGYIRQENQIIFSKWQPIETIYDFYQQSKQSKTI
jgi:hypothetical protein